MKILKIIDSSKHNIDLRKCHIANINRLEELSTKSANDIIFKKCGSSYFLSFIFSINNDKMLECVSCVYT